MEGGSSLALILEGMGMMVLLLLSSPPLLRPTRRRRGRLAIKCRLIRLEA